jgi:hypothetical protein
VPLKTNTIFLLCLLLHALPLLSQVADTTHRHSFKPTTDFDQRFYYTAAETQNIWGYRAGVLIDEKFKLGVGGYYMNKNDQALQSSPASDLPERSITKQMNIHRQLYLGTLYYEPFLMRRQLWEWSVVGEIGYGQTVVHTTDMATSAEVSSSRAALVPAGLGLSFNFKLPPVMHIRCFRWIGLNAMAGYRAAIYRQDKQYNYNGAYWSISGAIFLDRMLDDYRSWKHRHRQASIGY